MTPDEIPVFDFPVGVLVSGGADSALLLYTLLKKYKTRIHVFTITNKVKSLNNVKAALDVINKCIELTGNENLEHHIYYRNSQQDVDFHTIANLNIHRGLIKKIFIGITANPPAEIENTFGISSGQEDKRDPTVLKPEIPDHSNFILPWINVNKKVIASYYKSENLLDSLFPLTRSCEWIPGTTEDPGYNHCGHCWWCKERNWAFDRYV